MIYNMIYNMILSSKICYIFESDKYFFHNTLCFVGVSYQSTLFELFSLKLGNTLACITW